MATRLYLTGAAPPVTPNATNTYGGWEIPAAGSAPAAFLLAKVENYPGATAFGTTTSAAEAVATNAQDVCIFRHVSEPLAAQTLNGTIIGQMRISESAAGMNALPQIMVKVVSNDGVTLRGTLYAGDTRTTNVDELTTALRNQQVPAAGVSPASLSAVTCQAGDRLLVEIGVRANNTVSTSFTAGAIKGSQAAFGGANDLSVAGTEATNLNPWVEFSSDIAWLTASGSRQILYNISSLAGPTRQILYNVSGLAGPSRQILYDVRTLAQQGRVISYDIRSLAGPSRQVLYNVSGFAGPSRQILYDVRGRAGPSRQILYDVRGLSSQARQILYNISGLAGPGRVIAYDVRGLVGPTRQIRYDVRGLASAAREILYDVLTNQLLATGSRQIVYDVHALAGPSREIRYDVHAPVGAERQILYDTHALVGPERAVLYDVHTLASQIREILYDVRALAGAEREILFTVEALLLPTGPYILIAASRMASVYKAAGEEEEAMRALGVAVAVLDVVEAQARDVGGVAGEGGPPILSSGGLEQG